MWFRRIQLQENRERRTPPPPFFPPDSLDLRILVFKNE
uniref:Orf56 n=1 Tax=Cajanus scarabaeoides TaxID=669084 RepID=A0A1S5RVV7_9FABA|nr:orf56 [Cajanus scarabaeoides]AOY40521.1 orf56 [Cajanus scarabaeoides]